MSSKVAIIRTKPESVIEDVIKVMEMADMGSVLDKKAATILKNNLSWHLMYPGANTTPWQLEGAIRALRKNGFSDLVCVENETVVTSACKGEIFNKQRPVCEHYSVPIKYNFKPVDMNWQIYQPKSEMLVLDKIFPDGIYIPDHFIGKNVDAHHLSSQVIILDGYECPAHTSPGDILDKERHDHCHS